MDVWVLSVELGLNGHVVCGAYSAPPPPEEVARFTAEYENVEGYAGIEVSAFRVAEVDP